VCPPLDDVDGAAVERFVMLVQAVAPAWLNVPAGHAPSQSALKAAQAPNRPAGHAPLQAVLEEPPVP
jgi:hypothetical protein